MHRRTLDDLSNLHDERLQMVQCTLPTDSVQYQPTSLLIVIVPELR